MNTNDIIKSLGMVSPVQMPPRLIEEIYAALTERDELRAENERMAKQATRDKVNLMVSHEVSEENKQLRAVNKNDSAFIDELRQERIKLWRQRSELRAENERLYNEICDTEALKVENERLSKAIRIIEKEANNILWLADDSDYATALWGILSQCDEKYKEIDYIDELEYIE